ncbi:hypothetical protein N9L62_02070 [Candidatus Actinomarina sp.]|nr:hypothetical protein [Candidatus Actinomarina sp.]
MNLRFLKNAIFNNKKETILFIIFWTGLVWLKEINYLFYDTLDSPDFEKYSIYLDYFFTGEQTGKEHGLMYYYLQSLNYSFFYGDYQNIDFNIHKSIQNMNFYIFLFGLVGYYFLLRFFNFSKQTILITFIFINFFPPSIAMRLVFKPEILAFALLPWVVYLFERYKKDKTIAFLYLAIPLFASAITLKGNILVIFSIYFLITNYTLIFEVSLKNIILLILFFLVSVSLLTLENNSANGKTLLDIQSGSAIEENYNYKASKSIIYNIDIYELFSNPNKHNHADSFIGITLLETTGDYFDLYWDNDSTNYFKNRKNILRTIQSNEIKAPEIDTENFSVDVYKQRNSDRYSRNSLGLLVSIFMYFHLIKSILLDEKYRKFLVMTFIAMGILIFHSITGLPKNNFDPLVGDTFKPLYYSFALIFSFIFLIATKIRDKVLHFWQIILYCLIIVFILGFPKYYDYDVQVNLAPKIQNSIYCNIEKNIFLQQSDFEDISCIRGKVQIDDVKTNEILGSEIEHKPFNLLFIILNFSVSCYLLFKKRLFRNY